MIDMMTGGDEISRRDLPRLWNILENLCISRGLAMPKLKLMDSDALNAFASGLNQKQYSITVTRGLLERLDDADIEVAQLSIHIPDLDDVFFAVTGQPAGEATLVT
jgi:heat shock protein HtpX